MESGLGRTRRSRAGGNLREEVGEGGAGRGQRQGAGRDRQATEGLVRAGGEMIHLSSGWLREKDATIAGCSDPGERLALYLTVHHWPARVYALSARRIALLQL